MLDVSMPTPPDEGDRLRWAHTQLRRRMLTGRWLEDLTKRIGKAMGHVKAKAWQPDLSSNVFAQVAGSLSTLYDRPPEIGHTDPGQAANVQVMRGLLERAGYVSVMQEQQRMTLGLQEMLLRPKVSTEGVLTLRPVYPDLVTASPKVGDTDNLGEVWELRERMVPDTGEKVWVWTNVSVQPPGDGVYREMNADRTKDVTSMFHKPEQTQGFPYLDAAGAPVMPYVLYHARRTPNLFDPYHGSELVEGSLQAGMMWTFFSHCVMNASWPQRWGIGVRPLGTQQSGERSEVVADPATIIMFEPTSEMAEEGASSAARLGQFNPAASPPEMYEAVSKYEARVSTWGGMPAAEFLRRSGDPRSGYALALDQEGKREAARRFAPVFERSDLQLLRVVAVLYNRAMGTSLPETGWTIEYQALPPSSTELEAARSNALDLLDRALIDNRQALRLMRGIPLAEVLRDAPIPPGTPAPAEA